MVKKSNKDEFVIKANSVHNNKYDYSKFNYINNRTKSIIICRMHGGFEQRPCDHLQGKGCPRCGGSYQKTLDEFVEQANSIHNNKYDYSKFNYINAITKSIIICSMHGDFEQRPCDHLQGNGCPKCQSTYKQNKWLDSLRIPDDCQHREVNIKIGNRRFRADGYDPDTKTIYEFNGDSWHGNPKIYNQSDINPATKTTYGELYNKTISRENIFKNAGYKVVSIWESDFNQLIV